MSTLTAVFLGCYAALVAAAFLRSRIYGLFTLIVLAFPTWVGLSLAPHLGPFEVVVPVVLAQTYVHFLLLLVRPRLWPWWVQVAVSWPALWFLAAAMLAWPWAILAGLGLPVWGVSLPFVLTLFGLGQTLLMHEEVVDLKLDRVDQGPLRRAPEARQQVPEDVRPLTLVQITDPHLGPFMSVAKLRRICARAVANKPDLILITGDLMTMQSQTVETVAAALEPLADYRGRVFACHGNHDLEAREVVAEACARHGIRLLIDEAEVVQTPAGPVQIIGSDFVWRRRDVHLQQICDTYPRLPNTLRLLLLHDPGAFRHLPPGGADLTLSGHTHGGQLGLVSFGLPHTFVSMVSNVPDHGPWAQGPNRLYVHRAQGHYGYPIRLGVPAEHSLMRVWWPGQR